MSHTEQDHTEQDPQQDHTEQDPQQGGAEAVPDPVGIPEGESSENWGGAGGGAKPGEKPVTGIPEKSEEPETAEPGEPTQEMSVS